MHNRIKLFIRHIVYSHAREFPLKFLRDLEAERVHACVHQTYNKTREFLSPFLGRFFLFFSRYLPLFLLFFMFFIPLVISLKAHSSRVYLIRLILRGWNFILRIPYTVLPRNAVVKKMKKKSSVRLPSNKAQKLPKKTALENVSLSKNKK